MMPARAPPPLLDWLSGKFAGEEHAPPGRSLLALAEVAERLVRQYLEQRQPLRPAAVATKLATLSRNLRRAAKVSSELGEQGIAYVLLASGANRIPEEEDTFRIIAELEDLALWSGKAAETAKLMSRSAEDHKGGRTPDARLRSLMTMLMDRYEYLLGIRATHVLNPLDGRGHSTFDAFVKEAIRHYAPPSSYFGPRQTDDAISWALSSRASNFRAATTASRSS